VSSLELFQRAHWCFTRARELGVRGTLLITDRSLFSIGTMFAIKKASNDNEAKP